MTDNTLTEQDGGDDELIPVETLPEGDNAPLAADAADDAADEEDDGDDSRLAQSEDDHEDDIAASGNRDRRRKRREIQKKARDNAQRELEMLRRTVADLSQRVAQNETSTANATAETLGYNLEQQLARAINEVQQAENVIAAATEAGNGADVVAAMRIRDQAKDQAQQLYAAKQQVEQQRQQAAVPQVAPEVISHAREWMEANPWYDPQGRDRDSALTKNIDAQLVREGYDPRSRVYWEELTGRVAGALGGSEDGNSQAAASPRRKAPPTGNTREHAPVSTKREIYVTPERKQAMIEAGVWDDPVRRQSMLRAYQSYDNSSAR
jgi:hypothetical protein